MRIHLIDIIFSVREEPGTGLKKNIVDIKHVGGRIAGLNGMDSGDRICC